MENPGPALEKAETALPNNKKSVTSQSDLLGPDGKFKDSVLQANYEKYCERKRKAEEDPRSPEEWKEAVDYWAVRRKQGEEFADEKFAEFEEKYPNAKREITIEVYNPESDTTTRIRVDAINYDKKKGYHIQEYKSSEEAPYTKNQLNGFKDLFKYGGRVVGKGKGKKDDDGAIVGGMEIPPGTDVEVVRPSGALFYNKN